MGSVLPHHGKRVNFFTKVLALSSLAFIAPTSATSASVDTCALAMSTVPESMTLSPSMRTANVQNAKLIPLTFGRDGTVTEAASPKSASEVLSKMGGKHGSLCFVVRRPG